MIYDIYRKKKELQVLVGDHTFITVIKMFVCLWSRGVLDLGDKIAWAPRAQFLPA